MERVIELNNTARDSINIERAKEALIDRRIGMVHLGNTKVGQLENAVLAQQEASERSPIGVRRAHERAEHTPRTAS